MGKRSIKLNLLDVIIHFGSSILFGLPILFFTFYYVFGQLGLIEMRASMDETIVVIPLIILGPISLILFFIQSRKLRFEFIEIPMKPVAFSKMIKQISKESNWAIRSIEKTTFSIKTNPGYINQSWGQQITIELVKGGILVNSIFDLNKGSYLITFGRNKKNVSHIKELIMTKAKSETTYQ